MQVDEYRAAYDRCDHRSTIERSVGGDACALRCLDCGIAMPSEAQISARLREIDPHPTPRPATPDTEESLRALLDELHRRSAPARAAMGARSDEQPESAPMVVTAPAEPTAAPTPPWTTVSRALWLRAQIAHHRRQAARLESELLIITRAEEDQ